MRGDSSSRDFGRRRAEARHRLGIFREGGEADAKAGSDSNDEASTGRSLEPHEAWSRLKHGDAAARLAHRVERRRHGAPPGAVPVSLTRHLLKPEGEGAIYLFQHAVRSKAMLRKGAAELAGGFVGWERAGLPVERQP
jgi:hypothetical protein